MIPHTIKTRAKFYNDAHAKKYPDSHLTVGNRFITGVWMSGNNYKRHEPYYGAYPPNYLPRIISLFPDSERILHLFSGSLDKSTLERTFSEHEHVLIDTDPKSALKGALQIDAEGLSNALDANLAPDLVLADPPYSAEDAEHYGKALINKKKVINECWKILKPGGYLVWMDQSYPMFKKTMWKIVGTIGIIRSTNHRVRMVFIFVRL